MKKYERINRRQERHPVRDVMVIVWSVKALVDIPAHDVKAGDIGGSIDRKSFLPQTGDAWIGESAYVLDQAAVLDDAIVTDEAVISAVTVKNNARVFGNAVVLQGNSPSLDNSGFYVSNFAQVSGWAKVSGSYITDNSIVKDAAVVSRAIVKGKSIISGFARVIGPNTRLVDTQVYGSAEVMSSVNLYKSKIHCEAKLFPNSQISSSVLAGDNSIADVAITSNRRDTNGNLHETFKSKACMLEGEAVENCADQYLDDGAEPYKESVLALKKPKKQVEASSLTSFLPVQAKSFDCSHLEEVEEAYASYEKDIVKLIKYPVMTDLTDPFTASFHSLLRKARRAVEKDNKVVYEAMIEDLDDAFFAAESNARRIATSLFSDEDKVKVSDAGQMLAMAMDEKASETEKKNAYKAAMRNLEGRVSLPEVTISSLIEKIGLKELMA